MNKRYQLCAIVLAGVFFLAGDSLRAEDTPLTDDGIKALIKELGSDDFEKRQNAEKALRALGVKAEPVLKASIKGTTEPHVQATIARLLERLKLANIGNVDYRNVFPAESLFFTHVRNLSESIEKTKGTAIGKLYHSPAMESFRKKIDEVMNGRRSKQKALFDLWAKHFGQVACSVWQFASWERDKMRGAVIAQITDANPTAVFEDFLKVTGLAEVLKKSESYCGVDILKDPDAGGIGVLALVGSHVIGAPNRDSVKTIIDNLLKPDGVAVSPDYAKLKGLMVDRPEFIIWVDESVRMKQMNAFMEQLGRDKINMMSVMGVDMHRYMTSISANGMHYEERMAVTLGGNLKGLMTTSVAPPDATPPLQDMAVVPANAVAAGGHYANSTAEKLGIGDYLYTVCNLLSLDEREVALEVTNALKFNNGLTILKLREFEEKVELKLKDAFAGFKGSIGYYAVLGPGGILEAPDIGMFFTFADNAAAVKFSDALKKGLNSVGSQVAVREVEEPKRKIQQIDLVALGAKLPDKFPYNPVWAVEENRIFMTSSVQALRKQLSHIDNKTPGLLSQPDFVKALGLLKPEERRGQVLYVDMKKLMSPVGRTMSEVGVTEKGVEQALAALPPSQELFKELPPLILTSSSKGTTQELVIRSPIPPIKNLQLLGIGAWKKFGSMMPMLQQNQTYYFLPGGTDIP